MAIHKPEGYVKFPDPSKLTYAVTLTAQCDGSSATCKVNVKNVPPTVTPDIETIVVKSSFDMGFSENSGGNFLDPEGGKISGLEISCVTTFTGAVPPVPGTPPSLSSSCSQTENRYQWTATWTFPYTFAETYIYQSALDPAGLSSASKKTTITTPAAE